MQEMQRAGQGQKKVRDLRSRFNGTCGKYFFLKFGLSLLAIIPIIGLPNAICIHQRYICRHTQIVGMPLEFKGTSGKLLLQMIKWIFFSIITIGLYGMIVMPVRFQQWKTANTVFGPVTM